MLREKEESRKVYRAKVRNNPRNASRWLTLFEKKCKQKSALLLASFAFRFATWIFWRAKLAARCRFIFVDYFIVVERCNQTVKPEREIRTTINQKQAM